MLDATVKIKVWMKMIILLWKTLKDDLPVKTKLTKLNIHNDARCILCLDEEETFI